MTQPKKRICIIGAGPVGMTALYNFKLHTGDMIDIKCYEKQQIWGGIWNFTSRIGLDDYGEPIPNSMYRNMWSIGPKELLEASDYSFDQHFGKELPSYLPREMVRNYMEGRCTKGKCGDLKSLVNFQHVVKDVEYRSENDDFSVLVADLQNNTHTVEIFSHVIVATGVHEYPNIPEYPGISTFIGRILHSKDFQDALEYKGASVLLIGGRFSASEIAVQLLKYRSASRVICSARNAALDIEKIPEGIEVRSLPTMIENRIVTFEDGSFASVDVIIFCTGYLYHYPFLHDDLQFEFEGKKSTIYPPGVYKGTIWTKGGSNKLYHLGCYDTALNFPMWDAQALWTIKYILGQLPGEPISQELMQKSAEEWHQKVLNAKCFNDIIVTMKDFFLLLANDIDYPIKYVEKAHALLIRCLEARKNNILGYRDDCCVNLYTERVAPAHHTKWINSLDDSSDLYLK